MGTYLHLELKDKSKKGIKKANKIWNELIKDNNGVVRFNTRKDIKKNIAWIKEQPHKVSLQYINTVQQYNDVFPSWGLGIYNVKITMGDYLCSRMARYYLQFITLHSHLLVEPIEQYVLDELLEVVARNHVAKNCLVINCTCHTYGE